MAYSKLDHDNQKKHTALVEQLYGKDQSVKQKAAYSFNSNSKASIKPVNSLSSIKKDVVKILVFSTIAFAVQFLIFYFAK